MTLQTQSSSESVETISEMLQKWIRTSSESPLLLAPGREPFTWAHLAEQIDYIAAFLGRLGSRALRPHRCGFAGRSGTGLRVLDDQFAVYDIHTRPGISCGGFWNFYSPILKPRS